MYQELSKCVFVVKEGYSTLYRNNNSGDNYLHHIFAGIGLSNLQNTHVTSRFMS